MIVYLIRHGQAEDQSRTGRDSDRSLVGKGRDQADAVAAYLVQSEIETPVRVFASPYLRTMQTATPLWNALDQLEQPDDRLAATRSVSDILEVITQSEVPVVAVVSHNPIISRTADVLSGGPSAAHHFSMQPGQLIALRIDPDQPIGSAELIDQYRLAD